MTLDDFARLVPDLSGMGHIERIKHFGWFVLVVEKQDRFAAADITRCYDLLHIVKPGNVHALLRKLEAKKPPELLRDTRGYRLEARVKEPLDSKYGAQPTTVAVDAMLLALPGRVSDEAERLFLSEALTCFRNKAFRAAIVMTWNLAFDHLLNWIVCNHLAAFNAAIVRRYPKRTGVVMGKKEDFNEEFKESEVIEVCSTAGVVLDNTKKILNEKLTKRNMAAHPSVVEITQFQAQDVISDLVNNVILKMV
jgi:hypothetical protein